MDTPNTHRRAPKPSQDKKDLLRRRREREVRRAPETAEQIQERLTCGGRKIGLDTLLISGGYKGLTTRRAA